MCATATSTSTGIICVALPSPCCLTPIVCSHEAAVSRRILLTHTQTDKFPSSVAFDAINDALNSSDADRKDAIKNGKAVFGITLKNPAGETESWFIDLAKEGKVVKGLDKSDGEFNSPQVSFLLHAFLVRLTNSLKVELRLSDEDFGKLVMGKAKAQGLFMSGKLKIKGNVMKAAKLEPILNKARTKAKL